MLAVGTSITALGSLPPVVERSLRADGSEEVRERIPLRAVDGSILAHQEHLLTKVPVYQTSIPLSSGMSGGPVMLEPNDPNIPKQVIGFVCSSFQEETPVTDPTRAPLSSYVMPIAAAYLPELRCEDGDFGLFKELGGFRDLGAQSDRLRTSRAREGRRLQIYWEPADAEANSAVSSIVSAARDLLDERMELGLATAAIVSNLSSLPSPLRTDEHLEPFIQIEFQIRRIGREIFGDPRTAEEEAEFERRVSKEVENKRAEIFASTIKIVANWTI